MLEALNHITELLRDTLSSPWLWVLVFAVAALDALLPFMPSETTVVTVAVLLGPDVPRLALLVAMAAVGAFAGDCLSHWIGRRAGPRMLARLQRGERGQARYEWARSQVERRGALLIVAARYLPGGRVASGLATGSMGVSWARFIAYDALGTGIWAVYSVCIGAVGGTKFADEPAKGLLLSFGIGLLLVAVLEVARRIRSRYAARRLPEDDPGPLRRTAIGRVGSGPGRARAHLPGVDR
ncbi:membrane protein DedA, SNARE-associated domain [Amycolatopsis sacchari]|uniref:Membrane protein DedA, SNARE-associated domain n=1 Tax=Amycolatopsis sacchari TaxID=115433 RepID=A0A1I4CNF4_9PSEU|nr:DedA family protein [Amycolatopsis sacchari]SFK82283.1 membrane protein DedA, SNARE-associated domain [Amycolatopsis sacchari]